MFAVQLPMDINSGDSNYKQKTPLDMLILPNLLVFFLHLPCCCCDALIAYICSSCEYLHRDGFRLPTAPQLHIECKHNKYQADCCHMMPYKPAAEFISHFSETWRRKRFKGGAT